ncbi:hypothetical protein D3C71_1651460 [compost metagenome]
MNRRRKRSLERVFREVKVEKLGHLVLGQDQLLVSTPPHAPAFIRADMDRFLKIQGSLKFGCGEVEVGTRRGPPKNAVLDVQHCMVSKVVVDADPNHRVVAANNEVPVHQPHVPPCICPDLRSGIGGEVHGWLPTTPTKRGMERAAGGQQQPGGAVGSKPFRVHDGVEVDHSRPEDVFRQFSHQEGALDIGID